MVKPTNRGLYLGGVKVSTTRELVGVYRERIHQFGMTGTAMFYKDELQYQAKVAQFSALLHEYVRPNDAVLDVGCGFGSLAAVAPACRYTGIDLVPDFIDYAKERYSLLDFKVLDVEQFAGEVDWCVLLGVVNSVPRPDRTISSAWAKCRKGIFVDFVDATKLQADFTDLNRFDPGDCLSGLLRLGAQTVIVYRTPNVWNIYVALAAGKWLKSRK